MDEPIEVLSARDDGLVRASALRDFGVNSHAAAALVRRGRLVRIRRGMYVNPNMWQGPGVTDADRYRLMVRSSAPLLHRSMVVSHLSAAALHRLPLIGRWPDKVHATDPAATGGSSSRFLALHRGGSAPVMTTIDSLPVTTLRRTVVDVAATSSLLVAVAMIDHALRVEQERVAADVREGVYSAPALTAEDLYAELEEVKPRVGRRMAERAIGFANGLAASAGESLSRVRIFELGFEVPELQVCFPDAGGLNHWVDFYWRGIRTIGEFDGRHKYTRGAILGDRDPGEVVWREKQREDALRSRVDGFVRWDWDTAMSPRRFHAVLAGHGVPRAGSRTGAVAARGREGGAR